MIDFQVTKMYLNIVHSVYWAKLLLSIDLALFIVTFFLAVCVCVCVCATAFFVECVCSEAVLFWNRITQSAANQFELNREQTE